jgi:hypothetical protein
MNQTQVTTLTFRVECVQRMPLRCRCLVTWHCLRYSLDTSYCIHFRALSITHSRVFLVNHRISRISTQQWISRNLFTFGPMLIGTFLLKWGWGIPRKSLWHRFWEILYKETHCITTSFLNHSSAVSSSRFRAGSTFREQGGTLHSAVQIFQNPGYDYYTIDFDISVIRVSDSAVRVSDSAVGVSVGALLRLSSYPNDM